MQETRLTPLGNLAPTQAQELVSAFSRMIRLMGAARSAPRIVTAQRPAHESYRYKAHNGAKEMARRVRQMNRRGHYPDLLTVGVDGTRRSQDSHGQLCPFYS